MHKFIQQHFASSQLHEKLSNTSIYLGRRLENRQEVLIYELYLSTLSLLQTSINKFIHSLFLSGQGDRAITDWHVDILQNRFIFAVIPSKKAIIGTLSDYN